MMNIYYWLYLIKGRDFITIHHEILPLFIFGQALVMIIQANVMLLTKCNKMKTKIYLIVGFGGP